MPRDPLAAQREVVGADHDETQAALGDQLLAALVIEAALLAAVDSGCREPVGLVEKRGRLVVLRLAELDDQSQLGPLAVDR